MNFSYIQSQARFKPLKDIEITYQKTIPEKKNRTETVKPPRMSDEQKRRNEKALLGSQKEKSSLRKEISKIFHDMGMFKKKPVKMENMTSFKRKISIPPIKTEKINNPTYLNYYQVVRQRIKERAYVNYSGLDLGKVYVTFVIDSSGQLKDIKLIDEKTSADSYLSEISVKSVKEAAPFDSFPPNLDYPELTFNIVISFEAE